MDVQMPEMGDLGATRHIRSTFPAEVQPYIIMLTANARQGHREICLTAGADAYLAKPAKVDTLAEALEKNQESERLAL